MKALYSIIVFMLNATTGEPEQEYASSQLLTIEECNQALIERGPVPVKDNQAQYAVCRKVETKKVSL